MDHEKHMKKLREMKSCIKLSKPRNAALFHKQAKKKQQQED
jgi:hypothetical protein